MAKKPEYIVANGCLQEGSRLILQGEPFSPATPELAARLLAKGKLVEARGGGKPQEADGEGA